MDPAQYSALRDEGHAARSEGKPRFSDLLWVDDGRPRLWPEVHHLENLLDLSVEEVLDAFRRDQVHDFSRVLRQLEDPGSELRAYFARMRSDVYPNAVGDAHLAFEPTHVRALFEDLHDHVMSHPVWRHPFFARVFEGRITLPQAGVFARQYFNQIKNTRQCVALALGRFHGLLDLGHGKLDQPLSEVTQIVLSQLIADEYGVGTAGLSAYPSLTRLFESHTHIAMYRQLFEGLGIPPSEQDVPLLHGTADNVWIQRLVAGNDAFTPLEALASVGLGMEWGVPEFFSLLLGGMIRVAWKAEVPLTQEQLEVLIAHVKYDVLHGISVMLVTSFFAPDSASVEAVKGATNMLMSGRFQMMTDMHLHVFGEPCASIHDIGLAPRYHVQDRRMVEQLALARARTPRHLVVDGDAYRARTDAPFVLG